MRERVPLASIQEAVLQFLRKRDDAVLFGAQAVNAYTDESRMTQGVDILSTRARELAGEIRRHLADRFHIATRVREVRGGIGYRIYQVQKPVNRHLVDVRPVASLPPAQRVEQVLVAQPAELIAGKVLAHVNRRGKPKSGSDWRDVAMLLLRFPELKADRGPVRQRLEAMGAGEVVLAAWRDIVAQQIQPEEDEDEFQ